MDSNILHIEIPGSLMEFVRQQVELGGYGNAGEYVTELIRADQSRMVKASVEGEILKGLHSGDASPMTKEDWNSIREETVRSSLRKSAKY